MQFHKKVGQIWNSRFFRQCKRGISAFSLRSMLYQHQYTRNSRFSTFETSTALKEVASSSRYPRKKCRMRMCTTLLPAQNDSAMNGSGKPAPRHGSAACLSRFCRLPFQKAEGGKRPTGSRAPRRCCPSRWRSAPRWNRSCGRGSVTR